MDLRSRGASGFTMQHPPPSIRTENSLPPKTQKGCSYVPIMAFCFHSETPVRVLLTYLVFTATVFKSPSFIHLSRTYMCYLAPFRRGLNTRTAAALGQGRWQPCGTLKPYLARFSELLVQDQEVKLMTPLCLWVASGCQPLW